MIYCPEKREGKKRPLSRNEFFSRKKRKNYIKFKAFPPAKRIFPFIMRIFPLIFLKLFFLRPHLDSGETSMLRFFFLIVSVPVVILLPGIAAVSSLI